jgi:hypothetical protein
LELGDILRAHAGDYIESRRGKIPWPHLRVLKELAACRTAALGGHAWECEQCGAVQAAYNSCRNRHCPTCSGGARADWLQRIRADLLPTSYFHLVFTLPSELSPLVRQNAELLYHLLFRAAWEALQQVAADERHLGAKLGALVVLHTWKQTLDFHPHVHVVVPGGGLSPDGQQWVPSRDDFFLPVRVLSRVFRGKYLAGLKRAWRKGELKLAGKLASLADEKPFEAWLSPLYRKEWVVYSQSPPPDCGPEAVLKYLARYVFGVAISNHRLLSLADGQVTFRWKNRKRKRQETQTISAVEFLGRFLQHTLPTGFVRIRRYGFWANNQRAAKLARCRELLPSSSPTPQPAATDPFTPEAEAADAAVMAQREERKCPRCETGRLRCVASWPRPTSWKELLGRRLWQPAGAAPPAADVAGSDTS